MNSDPLFFFMFSLYHFNFKGVKLVWNPRRAQLSVVRKYQPAESPFPLLRNHYACLRPALSACSRPGLRPRLRLFLQ